jgi:hypothetical protein
MMAHFNEIPLPLIAPALPRLPCYMGLAYAERQLGKPGKAEDLPDWRVELAKGLESLKVKVARDRLEQLKGARDGKDKPLDNFELAHYADFAFAREFCGRFEPSEPPLWPKSLIIGTTVEAYLAKTLLRKLQSQMDGGQVYFDYGQPGSQHYFVTLHILRALTVLHKPPAQQALSKIVDAAKKFCIEQCFYCHRGLRHHQDPARLTFAGVIYCMYAEEVDRDLITAVVEALAGMQEPSGKWPTTHPIIRGIKLEPWYIASPELALSLTWLYFQPELPDRARLIVLRMLEKHFRNWIVPTYRRVRKFHGWYDDSAAGHEKVVGWASAIVCHFLANYSAVLNDHLNRRVIESLGLQSVAERYLIDETLRSYNERWRASEESTEPWPDLPPTAWSDSVTLRELSHQIWNQWTDPEVRETLSKRLAQHVLAPIFDSPQNRPGDYTAVILDGPPGTRKTTLVKALSQILRWPYVPVPASTIFERGFDNMEARASEVFRRLNFLTQCVIFFDEFEEFFRKREDKDDKGKRSASPAPQDRTIAAFTTSAMLPRIQALHDEKRSLIFLATNHPEKLDSAIMREGRFDLKATINHPTIKRFADSGVGFFSHPTKKTVENLKISGSEIKQARELKLARKAIASALRSDGLRCKITELQKGLWEDSSILPNPANIEKLRIKFKMVEKAAQEVLVEARSSGRKSTILKEKAAEVLTKLIDEAIDETNAEEKGRLSLP